MDSLREHIEREFEISTPQWIEKDNPVYQALKKTVSEVVFKMLDDYRVNSDYFFSFDQAKANKQDDFSLYEKDQSSFKDKLKILFARGTKKVLPELQRISGSSKTALFEDTELFETTELLEDFSFTDSTNLLSGFISGVTFPSLNSVSLQDYDVASDDFCDFVFSEPRFLFLTIRNNSEFSDDDLKSIIRRNLLPHQIAVIINIVHDA